jgi:parallel beta-helix repeat protein
MKTQTRELLQYCKLLALLLLAGVITTEETKAQSVQIGSGTQVSSPVTASPVNIYYRSLRCQFVYTAAELTASGASAGYLDSLGFYIDNAPVYGLPNYSIKMRATSFADVSMHDSGTLYEVYHHPLYQPMAGGFEMLKLDSLFFWNGSDNLLLDICFDQVNPNWSVTGKVRVFTANNGFRYIRSNSGSQCGNVTTSILNSKPQAILSFIPNLALNAGVSSIDSLDQVCEGSTQTAYARIRNWGTSSLTSVKVGWSLNGVLQSTNTFAVNLDGITGSGTKDTLVSLGPISFNLGQSYTIQAWTEMPNGGVDGFPQNDSLTKVVSPSLLGTYTIGGINPDFATFAAAVNQLNEAGICDSVRFLVRPGTYNEQLVLSAISGTDSLHQVVFTAENGDSSSVVLSFASSLASQNYTVLLDESQYVRFDRLTLQGNGPNYGRVVEFRNGASQNEFRHCAILGSSVSTDSTDHALIYTDLNEGSYLENQFVGNRLQHGSYGLYWYDVYQSEDLTIADNQFFDQYAGGIYLQSISELTISGNQIQSTSSDSAFQGIYLVSVDQPEILNNQISLTNGGHGIYLSNTYGTFGDSGLVANNFVSISGTNPAYGIHYHSGSELKFVFNNVNLGAATDSSSRSFYFHPYDESSTVRNNNLVNWGSGFALYVKQDLFLVSDYNNLFSPNGRVGYYDGTTLTTLADWQLITGFDAHSLSVNPLYVSLQDLHVQKGLLNAAGVADISVPHDIDGELRSNPPDLGADEFTATQTDVIAVQILHPPTPFPAGSIPLSLVIQNGGGTSLSSLTVDWKVNGSLQSSLNWSGSLATGQKDTLLLGNWNFTGGTPFDIMAWTSSPNGGSDFDTSDDTTSVDYLIAGLSGSYTIGGSNPDFADFTAATNALNTGGILDSVTFLVRPGTYNEQLLIHEFPGNSCTRPVVFQAENGDSSSVILTFNANSNANYTVFLNGADGIQFRKLTLEASNGTYSRVLHLDNGVKCHVLSHSVLQGSAGPFSSNERTLVYSTGAGAADSSIQILQNRLVGGSYSVFLNGTSDDLGTHISNNQLENLGGYGIFLQYQNAPLVQFNQINSDSANAKGIYLGDCSGALRIEGNRISFPDGGYGIFLQDCYGASGDSGLIANNFIYLGGPDYADGMYLKDYSHLRVRHNNVHITSTDVSGGRALYLSGYHADDVFQNNNFVNTGGGKALVFNTSYYGLHDYNNLYSTGSSLVDADGVSYADLSTWQSSSGLEQHSISINPLYASVSDLHVNKPLLNGAGVYVPDPLDDIDGELRNNPPDIGADEFSVTGMDVMATYLEGPSVPFAAGSYPLSFGFRNVGTDTLNSLLVNWQVNGALQASVNWTGTLAPGGSDTVLLGSLTLNNGNIYLLESWTSLPNGLPDVDPTDDTLSVGLSPALAGTYTIGGSTPDYSSLNEASYALGLAGIADTVVFNIRNGTYQEQLVIGSFPGMDCSLPVIFQSETQDSAAVRIRYQGSANANYVLHLRGVQGLVFRYLTLEALDANYSRVVVFEEGPDCNLFEGNHIFGPSTTATTSGQALVDYDGDALCVNNHFVGNHFENASMGIRWYNTGPLDSGLVVQDNLFEEQYYMGVFAARQFAPQFQGNTVRTLNGDADFYGFYLEECEAGMHISGNQIDMPGGGIGVYLPFSNGTTADPNLIANNFIHVGGSATDYGISLNYSPHTRIAHNSVHITSTDSLSGIGIVRGANSSGVSLFNNNLVNSGGGLALRIVDTESFQSDHNNFYTTGPQLAYRDMQHADLAAWQSYTAEDGNSLSTDPLFVSPSDLHVSNAALDGAGTPISDISFDIDGNTRDPYAPDIGADEFATATADAGLFGLLSPAPLFAEGDHPVKVVLFNNATLPLASVTVHWAVDTFVQTPVAWTGNLAPGDSAQLTLGNFTFNIGQPYTLKAWLSDPNGVPDQQTQNDTLLVDSLYASLAGYYTIGGANPNFNSFNEAVNVAMLSGVVDSVIFNVRSDTFWEQVIIPAIPGASAQNRIVFQAESGDSTDAVLAYAASSFNPQYTVLLDGADFIEFRHLTLLATGTTYGRPLELKNEAQNLRVSHCELIGTGTSSSTALVYGNSYQYHHLSFTHNLFRGGKEGIYLRGYSSSLLSSGILIENNIFEDQTGSSVYLRYMDAPVVRANEFQSAVLDNYGIYCYFCDHEMLIADNQLQLPDASRVIYLYRCDGQINQRGLVANNFIYNNRANGGEGLYVYYATYLDVVFNSVHLQGSSSGKAISMFGGSQLRLQNNIFTHTGGGYSLYSNSGSNIALADYNDYSPPVPIWLTGTPMYPTWPHCRL